MDRSVLPQGGGGGTQGYWLVMRRCKGLLCLKLAPGCRKFNNCFQNLLNKLCNCARCAS